MVVSKRKILSLLGQFAQPFEHNPSGFKRRLLRLKRQQLLSNRVGIDVFQQSKPVSQQMRASVVCLQRLGQQG